MYVLFTCIYETIIYQMSVNIYHTWILWVNKLNNTKVGLTILEESIDLEHPTAMFVDSWTNITNRNVKKKTSVPVVNFGSCWPTFF